MKKGTKSKNAGGRLHPLQDSSKILKKKKRTKNKMYSSIKEAIQNNK